MQPKEIKISDELRDQLSECLKPYVDACDPEKLNVYLSRKINSPEGGDSGIFYRIANDVNDVLQSSDEGKKFLENLIGIYQASGKFKDSPAILYSNMPSDGEGAYLMAGLRVLLGGREEKLSILMRNNDHAGQYLHKDDHAVTISMLQGYESDGLNNPTLLLTKQEIIEKTLELLDDDSISNEDVRKVLLRKHLMDMNPKNIDKIQNKINQVIYSEINCNSLFDASHKVDLKIDNMLVFNNNHTIRHCRGHACNVEASGVYRLILGGSVQNDFIVDTKKTYDFSDNEPDDEHQKMIVNKVEDLPPSHEVITKGLALSRLRGIYNDINFPS